MRANQNGGQKKPASAAEATPGRRRLPMLLRRCWYNLNQGFRRRIAHTGMTPDQFTVLRTLTEGPRVGLTQRQLSDQMSSDANTIASLLERMAAAGWVERKAHEQDRRANRIRIKPPGRRKYAEVREIALGLQREVLEVLPEARRGEFLEHLELVGEACQRAASPKSNARSPR